VILKPEKLDAQAREEVAALGAELLVSFAYGRIFGPKFLALFPRGGLNIHPSLLPKYRGASPISAAILNRDRETGVTVQRLALEMDAGDILAQERIPLSGQETTGSLSESAAERGAVLLLRVLEELVRGGLSPCPQNGEEASYCPLISKDEGAIDWTRDALDIDARIRAYTPWPLSWTSHGGQTLFILEGSPVAPGTVAVVPEAGAAVPPGTVLGIDKNRGILVQTGDGVFAVRRLQYRTKKALPWKDFLNGAKDLIGARLI
jgi:methionyl-tRNA formyltransferase